MAPGSLVSASVVSVVSVVSGACWTETGRAGGPDEALECGLCFFLRAKLNYSSTHLGAGHGPCRLWLHLVDWRPDAGPARQASAIQGGLAAPPLTIQLGHWSGPGPRAAQGPAGGCRLGAPGPLAVGWPGPMVPPGEPSDASAQFGWPNQSTLIRAGPLALVARETITFMVVYCCSSWQQIYRTSDYHVVCGLFRRLVVSHVLLKIPAK